ncbi:tyrosine-type recombinase/integrase [Massilia sp. CMS3.1]|uniref:tyrosine-type recombinase/integrase n=1 Tax=Massilia sp. CMS3.1 TaxID=3373083 RepID=UPI003EE6A9A6
MASFQRIGEKWQARIRKKGFPSTSENFDTKKEAEKWAAKTETEMNEKLFKDKRAMKDLTVGKLVDEYFGKETTAKPFGDTKKANLNRIKRMLGSVLLTALKYDRLVFFVSDRAKEGAGGVTIGMDIAELAAVIRAGRKRHKYDFDIAVFSEIREHLSDLGLETKSHWRDRRPTEEELNAIKKHFNEKTRQKIPMSDIIDFAVATTMRASEITSIRWSDVDFDKRTVIIRDRKHPTKKKGNHQKVPLLPQAWAILNRQPRTSDKVFPYDVNTISTIFPRAVQACGIENLHFHDLRHEGTSKLFEIGYDIPRVAIFTGHNDWKMLSRYVQLRAEDLHPDEDGNLPWLRLVRKPEQFARAA